MITDSCSRRRALWIMDLGLPGRDGKNIRDGCEALVGWCRKNGRNDPERCLGLIEAIGIPPLGCFKLSVARQVVRFS